MAAISGMMAASNWSSPSILRLGSRAFALAVENPRPGCEIYNLGADETIYIKPLAEMHTGAFAPPAGWPPFKSLLNCDKAKAHFGWKPEWNFLDEFTKHNGEDPRKKAFGSAA